MSERITLEVLHAEVKHVKDNQLDNKAILKEILHALHGTEDSPGLSKKVYSLEQSRASARKHINIVYTILGGGAVAWFGWLLDVFKAPGPHP